MSYLFRCEFVCVLRLSEIVTHVLFVHVLERLTEVGKRDESYNE